MWYWNRSRINTGGGKHNNIPISVSKKRRSRLWLVEKKESEHRCYRRFQSPPFFCLPTSQTTSQTQKLFSRFVPTSLSPSKSKYIGNQIRANNSATITCNIDREKLFCAHYVHTYCWPFTSQFITRPVSNNARAYSKTRDLCRSVTKTLLK